MNKTCAQIQHGPVVDGLWIPVGDWSVSLQVEHDGKGNNANGTKAYLAVEDLSSNNPGHELAIGVDKDGPFLQTCDDGKVNIVNLHDLLNDFKKLNDRVEALESKNN